MNELKFSNEKPKVMDLCEEKFGVSWDQGIIITYGDTIHAKNLPIHPTKMVHEMVHVKQQTAMNKDLWWKRYLEDPKFRLDQELEAYKEEIKYIKKHITDRNEKARMIWTIQTMISSYIYGNMISFPEARKILK